MVKTKVGDIFKVGAIKNESFHLQLVAIDPVSLNSDTIVVFDGNPADNDARRMFYTHTTVAQGLREGLWSKIGNGDVNVKLSDLVFKNFNSAEDGEAELLTVGSSTTVPYPNWVSWSPQDENWAYISYDDGLELAAEDGGIFPAQDIIHRIETGKSGFKNNWPT
jgi:hypothetical protein